MVEVFKTNIIDKNTAEKILDDLNIVFPGGRINFDLDDCDKILRVEHDIISAEEVTRVLARSGYTCELLE
jgi:DNA-directed RNA polymerase subunit H (RpoH/RPB5)